MSYAAVIVEPRKHFALRHVIKNMQEVLPEWQIYFFCGKGLASYWNFPTTSSGSAAASVPVVKVIELNVVNLDANTYSDLLKTRRFWEQIDAERILIFQTDSILCKNSPYKIQDFFRYDYVGACSYLPWEMPWVRHSDYPCIIGGLSLRTKQAMLDAIDAFPPLPSKNYWDEASTEFRQYAEDTYFFNCLHFLGRPIGMDEFATRFCTQCSFRTETFGAHKFYVFLKGNDLQTFLTYCPEGRDIIPSSKPQRRQCGEYNIRHIATGKFLSAKANGGFSLEHHVKEWEHFDVADDDTIITYHDTTLGQINTTIVQRRPYVAATNSETNNCWKCLHVSDILCLTRPPVASAALMVSTQLEHEFELVPKRLLYINYQVDIQKEWSNCMAWKYAVQAFSTIGLVHEKAVLLDSFVERSFVWGENTKFEHMNPWIGIIHNPPALATRGNYFWQFAPDALVGLDRFKRSMQHCLGIIVLSRYLADYLATLPIFQNIPISWVYHPIDDPHSRFSFARFSANSHRMLVQVGFWLRNKLSIYKLAKPALFSQKAILPFTGRMESELNLEMKLAGPGATIDLTETNVARLSKLSDKDYDDLLCQNVVFVDFLDASANNTVLECIIRHTPIIVNRIAPVVEYLGDAYPLYFDTLEEATEKGNNLALLEQAHYYLRDLKIDLTTKTFVETIVKSKVYDNVRQYLKV